jgi:DNA-binding Lrp family transcriptional regulator
MSTECFIFIKTNLNARRVLSGAVLSMPEVFWAKVVYGPYQIAAYLRSDDERALTGAIEELRAARPVLELDVRRCKPLPEDAALPPFADAGGKPVRACLLINVDYRQEKERVVTLNLRQLQGVTKANAMWGPTDIVALVEAEDHESLRNLICDDIKVMKGIATNTTLFCYPD